MLVSVISCRCLNKDICTTLFENNSSVNDTQCSFGFVHGFDTYTIKGKVSFATETLKSIGLENVQKDFYYCLIPFFEGCQNDTSHICYCLHTENNGTYDLVFTIFLHHEDSNATVRAVMIIQDEPVRYSNEIMLPQVANIEMDNVSYELTINDQRINSLNCSLWLEDPTMELSYNISSTPTLPGHLSIEDHNTLTEIKKKSETYTIKNWTFMLNSTIVFLFNLCGRVEKKVFCNYSIDMKFVNVKDYTSLQLPILIIVLGILALLSAGFIIHRYLRKKDTKNFRKKHTNNVPEDITDTEMTTGTDLLNQNLYREKDTFFLALTKICLHVCTKNVHNTNTNTDPLLDNKMKVCIGEIIDVIIYHPIQSSELENCNCHQCDKMPIPNQVYGYIIVQLLSKKFIENVFDITTTFGRGDQSISFSGCSDISLKGSELQLLKFVSCNKENVSKASSAFKAFLNAKAKLFGRSNEEICL
ncbi:polymorphic transmembrane cluster 2 transmembrane protein 1 [Biomphalaria glabrata]|nr:polymorphic transmembrane cluster 2 transmembrane protein 1 [Biomphalaria glabrata]